MNLTEQMIKEATPEQLNEWTAVYVMGWKIIDNEEEEEKNDVYPYVFKEKSGCLDLRREDEHGMIDSLNWCPAEYIKYAIELIEKIKNVYFKIEMSFVEDKAICVLWESDIKPFVDTEEEELPIAISRVVLLAHIKQ